MKKPIRIFLGDLTYDTITVSTESFPLNVGYIASYCLSKFGSEIDITIFKYIDKLEKAIRENPRDILGLSNYVWNHRIGYELFTILHEIRPNAIKIWGGPNFPLDIPSQEKFMKKYEIVDEDEEDGKKLIFKDSSWILVRLSGTEPVFRIYIESENKSL